MEGGILTMDEGGRRQRKPTLLEAVVAVVVSFACIGIGVLALGLTFIFPS